jgi:flagellar motor switch protein FliN/FliY
MTLQPPTTEIMNTEQPIDRFVRVWVDEFTRAVEMFTAVKPTVSWCRLAADSETAQGDTAALIWWKQRFQGAQPFITWIGAADSTRSALAGSLSGETGEAQEMYLEMLGQAQQGAATVLSSGLLKPLTCEPGALESNPPPAGLDMSAIKINLDGKDLAPLILALDPEAASALAGGKQQPEEKTGVPALAEGEALPPMLDRLMDLELPVSVALGRAVLPIQDILKITSGSLIELDRDVGEHVELLVHGTVVARGEVVSIKGNYGLRIKEIISRQERIALHGKSAKQQRLKMS